MKLEDIIKKYNSRTYLAEQDSARISKNTPVSNIKASMYKDAFKSAYNDVYSQVKDIIKNQTDVQRQTQEALSKQQEEQDALQQQQMQQDPNMINQQQQPMDPNQQTQQDPNMINQQQQMQQDPNAVNQQNANVTNYDPQTGEEINDDQQQFDDNENVIDPMTGQPYPPGQQAIDPMTGQPILSQLDVSNLYQLKKISQKLNSLLEITENEIDPSISELNSSIDEAYESFNIMVENYPKFKNNIDNIILTYYEFIAEITKTIKDLYKQKLNRHKKEELEEQKEEKLKDNDEISISLK